MGQFSTVPLRIYRKPSQSAMKSVIIGPLEPPVEEPTNLKSAKLLDTLWVTNFVLGVSPVLCPFWSGFMQLSGLGEDCDKSRIEILPFINQDPSQPNTIYSALYFAQKLIDHHNLGTCPVTFDQPLYIKATGIVASVTDLPNIFIRLGGFHLTMSYMGSLGFIMAGSGLESMWETVYAPNSIPHMQTGHAYARALRAHILSAAVITSLLLENPGCLTGVNIQNLGATKAALFDGELASNCLHNQESVPQVMQVIDDLMLSNYAGSRTGKLWVNYLIQVYYLKLFLFAERTGDCELHLYCICKMIPMFHNAGHFAYAKAARLYLQQMKSLQNIMTLPAYEKFAETGYFAIRRSNNFWSDNFSDQTIEQELMRLLKSSGGMTHGRGITDSSLMKWVHAIPYNIPTCDALGEYSGVHSHTSEQHKDLRQCSTNRDSHDCTVFTEWLGSHSQFGYTEYNAVVSVSSRVVSDNTVNCDQAFDVGEAAASSLTGKVFSDIKLSRNDRVVSITGSRNTIKVRGQEVVINPTLLFLRITCVIKNKSEMKNYLKYELAKQPPSLFDKGIMRKGNNSTLGNILKTKSPIHSELSDDACFVLDGGHLLHVVPWPADGTYSDVCLTYISYVEHHYGQNTTVVFDGYNNMHSTKSAEQRRRAALTPSADIIFELDMKATTPKKSFLINNNNKARLIDKLMLELQHNGINCKQHESDADHLIISTAMEIAGLNTKPVVVVGTDTDLLVMLVAQCLPNMNIFMLFQHSPAIM